MRKPFVLLVSSFILLTSNSLSASEYLQMLNSYVSVKLHLDSNPSRGQMVGAAWIRLRNNTESLLTEIPYILNPGLQVTKVLGANNQPLRDTSSTSIIGGYEFLEATVGTINLSSPIKPDSDIEVVIHFRGSLQNLSWAGVEHAKETLDANFTVLRADSFGYPVIAAPEKKAISAALNQPPYFQTATVEVADTYIVAGNIHVDETTLKGTNKSYSMKHTRPTAPMVLPISRYHQSKEGPLVVSVFEGDQSAANSLITAITPEITRLSTLLGTTSSGKLNITMVPDGYGAIQTTGLVTLERSQFTADRIPSKALLNLWGVGTRHSAGHWRNSLDTIIKTVASGATTQTHGGMAFDTLAAQLSENKKLAKATLESLTEDGNHNEAEALTSIVLAGLYDIMGSDEFFEFVRHIRAELRGNYADNIAFVEFVTEELKHKKARKFAKNWLSGKKVGKDLKKAKSFDALVNRYK